MVSLHNYMNRQHNIIWIDLDDVCAAWTQEAQRILNMPIEPGGLLIPQPDWIRLCSHERFYRDLPLLAGASELVEWATTFADSVGLGVSFLTGIPSDGRVPFCKQDKQTWVQRHFPHIPVTFGPYPHDKPKHCKKGDILIDDRPENCHSWTAAGGIAHVYSTWENCQIWINTELTKHLHHWR